MDICITCHACYDKRSISMMFAPPREYEGAAPIATRTSICAACIYKFMRRPHVADIWDIPLDHTVYRPRLTAIGFQTLQPDVEHTALASLKSVLCLLCRKRRAFVKQKCKSGFCRECTMGKTFDACMRCKTPFVTKHSLVPFCCKCYACAQSV